MVNEFCGFKHGVIGTNKMPADTTLNNMKKADLIKLLHTAQHNYETLMWFYNNAVKVNMTQLNNDGWIPCEIELPKVSNSYLVTKMCENEDNPIYETAHEIFWTNDGKWDCERDEYCEWKVIAWQNKFAPYQPKGE